MDKETFLKRCILPPWLWCWLILYILSLRSQIFYWKSFWDSFSSFERIIESIPELVPSLALFIGVVLIFFPKIRGIWLEYKFKLEDFETGFSKLPVEDDKEYALKAKEFLRPYTSDLQIKVNFNIFNKAPLIYASGYRKTSIALFSYVLDLWDSDEKTAKAVLLHELGHYRDGDARVLGAGNFLEVSIRSSLIIILLFLVPFILSIAGQEYTFIKSMIGPEASFVNIFVNGNFFSSQLVNYELKKILTIYVPFILSITLMLLVNVISTLFMPIVGIWCAELNADRFMADASADSDAAEKALNEISEKSHINSWLLSLIFHPPKWLRKHMIKNCKLAITNIVLLLIYPLADLFQVFIYQLRSLFMYMGTDTFNSYEYLKSLASYRFPIYAVLILVWPFISVYWVKFFSGVAGIMDWKDYKQYAASAGIVLSLSILLSFIINFRLI